MIDKDNKPLAPKEIDAVQSIILLLLKNYKEMPPGISAKNIMFNTNPVGEQSVSFYSLPGACIKEKWISGSFVGQYPFRLVYMAPLSVSNKQRILDENFLNCIGRYLEELKKDDFPVLDDNRTVLKIERTVSPAYYKAEKDGMEWYEAQFNLEYRKECR